MNELLQSRLQTFIKPALWAVLVFVIGRFISKIITHNVKKKIHGKYDSIEEDAYSKKVADMVGTIVFYVLMLFTVLISFQVAGFNVGILMAGISFAIGFGMEKTLANMIAGIMIATNSKIKTGVTIQILGDYDVFGKIEKLSTRHTIVRLFDGRRLILPNKKFMETPVKTRHQQPYIRTHVAVGITLEEDVLKAKKLLRDAVNEYPHIVQKKETFINIEKVSEEGLVVYVYFYLLVNGKVGPLQAKSDIRNIVLEVCREHAITIPYPKKLIDMREV